MRDIEKLHNIKEYRTPQGTRSFARYLFYLYSNFHTLCDVLFLDGQGVHSVDAVVLRAVLCVGDSLPGPAD